MEATGSSRADEPAAPGGFRLAREFCRVRHQRVAMSWVDFKGGRWTEGQCGGVQG